MSECPKDFERELESYGIDSRSVTSLSNRFIHPLLGAFAFIAFIAILIGAFSHSTASPQGDSSANTAHQSYLDSYKYQTIPDLEMPTVDFNFPSVDYTPPSIPTISTPAISQSTDIVFVRYPKTVRRNEEASVKIKGAPNTRYSITVEYSSGPSTADGLDPKYSDSQGYVTWYWHVGGRTNPGTFTITVSGGGKSKTVSFKVVT